MCVCVCVCDFHDGSDGKESACYAGDLGSIPGLGRSPREVNSCAQACVNSLLPECLGGEGSRLGPCGRERGVGRGWGRSGLGHTS